jgi:hypothetical protein
MEKIKSKEKIILNLLGFLAAVLLVFHFFLIPLLEDVKNISRKTQEYLADEQFKKENVEKLPEMDKAWFHFDSRREVMDIAISPENQIQFIEGVESIAVRTGNVISLEIGEEVTEEDLKAKKVKKTKNEEESILDKINQKNYFPIKINLKGNYPALCGFIHLLENGQFYVNVISLDISKEEIESEGGEAENNDPFSKTVENKEENDQSQKEILNTTLNAIVYTNR